MDPTQTPSEREDEAEEGEGQTSVWEAGNQGGSQKRGQQSRGSDSPRRGDLTEAHPQTSLLDLDLNGTQIVPELGAMIGSSGASIPHPDRGQELLGRTPDL